jgi:kynurenine formamidase
VDAVLADDEAVSEAEFDELFWRCSTWGRWGDSDSRGALNYIGPEQVVRAARLVTAGVPVSCARPVVFEAAVDNPAPALRYMSALPNEEWEGGSEVTVSCDFLGLECHGEVQSHIDALCHIAFRGQLYNGVPASTVSASGAARLGIEAAVHGLTARGVLLDIAALRGVRWLEGGYQISAAELEEAQRAAGVTVQEGDVLLIRTGHALRRQTEGPWDSAREKAGLHPRAMPWLADRHIAALGSDGDSDAAPSACADLVIPAHVLGITAMGLHFFDALALDDLAAECVRQGRHEFLFTAAPVHAVGQTGTAINPVAVF